MASLADKFAEKAKGAPYVSIATALAAPLSLALMPLNLAFPFIAIAAASPTVVLAAGGMAGFNMMRERSKLSKTFSAAAIGAAVLGTAGYLSQINAPDFGALTAFFYSTVAMTAAGALNVAAHYTRNVSLQVNASVKLKKDDDKQPPAPPPPAA
jgi:hypothetical protein